MRRRTKNRVYLLGLLALLGFLLTCGTEWTGGPSTESSNPATRPTPGFALINGRIDLNPGDLSAFSSLKLPAVSIGSSIPALHVNLSASDDESADGAGDILVHVTNSMGDSFLTVADDDGSFAVKARKGVSTRLELFEGDKYLATMVFGVDATNPETTDTFLIGDLNQNVDLGVIAQHGRWAVPEVNPLEPAEGEDSSGEDVYATVATVRTFTMEGKTLNRDVNLDDFDDITIIDSTINGHVSIANAEKVFIDPTGISSLSIADSGRVTLEELTVESDLALDSIDNLKMIGSRVAGNTSMRNIGSGWIQDSDFEGELATDEAWASAVTETRNTKGKAKDDETASEAPLATQAVGRFDPGHKNDGGVLLAKRETAADGVTSAAPGNDNARTVSRTTETAPTTSGIGITAGSTSDRWVASRNTWNTWDTSGGDTSGETSSGNGMAGYVALALGIFLCFCLYFYLIFRFARKQQQQW